MFTTQDARKLQHVIQIMNQDAYLFCLEHILTSVQNYWKDKGYNLLDVTHMLATLHLRCTEECYVSFRDE